jgi:flagellar hook-associated protein FlgK
MGLGFGFDSGLRGLAAARMQMQVTGHNIANVGRQGYSRQRAILASSMPATLGRFQLGTGVNVASMERVVDEQLDSRIRTQQGLFGGALIQYRRYTEIEGILGEPGESGMSSLLGSMFSSLGKLQTDPASTALRGGFSQSAQSMTDGLNLLSTRLGTMSNDTFAEVSAHIKNVNEYAAEIANLNKQITAIEANGAQANDLRDQREQSIRGLAELMDTRVIDRGNGVADILAGGYMLVSGGRASELTASRSETGKTQIYIGEGTKAIEIRTGRIAALLDGENDEIPGLIGQFDDLAYNMALEFNRLHTTGLPRSGGFESLVSENAVVDGDQDGDFSDELLAYAGLPFDISNGALYVAVTNKSTGNLQRSRIDIDANDMTVGDFAAALSAVSNISATVDPTGRLRVSAESGYRFDFSTQLDVSPNTAGTMSGASATLGGSESGPFDFSTLPADFTISVDGGPGQLITLNAADFAVPSIVPAEELVTVLNNKFSAAGVSARATQVGESISLLASSTGAASSLQLTEGTNTPLGTIGLPSGVTSQGSTDSLEVTVSGSYSGDGNGFFRFIPDGDGEIGVTPGLTVGVFDETGTRIATLDVGQGYSHGDELDVAHGVTIAFKSGRLSGSSQEQFAFDTLADPDTADALVAFGLNTFFTGSTASNLGIAERIMSDPNLIAAGLKPNSGDGANLGRLLEMRDLSIDNLGGLSVESFYSDLASEVGFETKRATDLIAGEEEILSFLEEQREAISGVNIDEEMVNLVQYQQAFQASSRFINTVNEMTEVLINLGR